jgi:hypothetical protein
MPRAGFQRKSSVEADSKVSTVRVHHFETIAGAISKLRVHHPFEFGRARHGKNPGKSATKLVNATALAFV